MSYRARQILFFSAVVIFITVLTVILFYGSGYHINWSSGDITATSGINVTAWPETATITLQPDDITKATPARFTQLEPGAYTIIVSAPGYGSQTLAVNLKAKAAIQFDPIQLWPNHITPRLADTALEPANATPNTTMFNNELAVIHKNAKTGQWLVQQSHSLALYDPTTGTTNTLVRLADPITAATWHSNGWYVLYSTPQELHSIDTRLEYTNSDTVLAAIANIEALQCAANGITCLYRSGTETYSVPLQ